MLRLAVRTLRARKGSFIAAFVALFFASALLTACGVLLETGIAGGVPTERYQAAAVVVAGDQSYVPAQPADRDTTGSTSAQSQQLRERVRVDSTVANEIAAVAGVRAVVPDVSFPVTIASPGTTAVGHSWASAELAPYQLRAGTAPTRPDEVVLDASIGLGVGDQVLLQVDDRLTPYRVAGVASLDNARQPAVFFSEPKATELAGHPGRVDALGVLAQPGTDPRTLADRIEQALPEHGFVVATGLDRGSVEFLTAGNSLASLIALSAAFGGTAMMVALFVVSATLAVSVRQRLREMALLRAIGTTPGQIRRMICGEALIVAAVAGLLGCLPGLALAKWLRSLFVDRGILPTDVAVVYGPLPPLVVVAALVVAALVAGRIAARRAATLKPTEALGEAAAERKVIGAGRLITGLVLLAVGVAGVVLANQLTGPAAAASAGGVAMVLIVAAAVLGPVLAKVAAVLTTPILRGARASGYLATRNNLANARRMAGSITPLVLAVGLGCVSIFTQTTMLRGAEEDTQATITADYTLSAPDGIPTAAVDAVRAIPGVASATSLRQTQLIEEHTSGGAIQAHTVDALAIDPGRPSLNLDMRVRVGSLDQVRGSDVALSQQLADTLGARIGDRVKLRLGDTTPTELRLVAVFDRENGLGQAVIDRTVVAGHTTSPRDEQILVRLDPGANRAAVTAALTALGQSFPGLGLADRDSVRAAQAQELQANAWVNFLVVGLILVYMGIAVVNTLVMATSARSRELALLRLVGGTRRQALRMIRWESLVLVLTAILTGSAIAAVTLVPFSKATTGSPIPDVPPAIYFGLIGLVALLGLIATEIPARLALRQDPVAAIGIRE
ncbi:FtsX-like permease family protein [Actinocrispum wychmicini]|uniref:Putative ABC transport system permease protein n=1 Tax=Actinocrispum wychmicini TaxID=1213861 RepID=A0A4R2JXJ9_9PSEU|nr:FtsX-like permease family protein [Actinocrispum wychmicini]TCO62138.1 putative ABC transport system permease protein [Actinocrispum wychmicini]